MIAEEERILKKERMPETDEKQAAGEIADASPFLKGLSNFWYHHKWWIPIAAAFLIFFVVAFVQCAGREKTDMVVTFSGPYSMSAGEVSAIEAVLQSAAPKKEDGALRKLTLQNFAAFNEEELRALYTETDADGKERFDNYGFNTAKNQNAERMSSFSSFLMTGECAVWFVSRDMYEQQNMQKLAAPLSETLSEVPSGAYDAYAIRLGDTEFYRYYTAMQVLPEDTLVVLTKSYVWGASNDTETYDAFVQLFCRIATFQRP